MADLWKCSDVFLEFVIVQTGGFLKKLINFTIEFITPRKTDWKQLCQEDFLVKFWKGKLADWKVLEWIGEPDH